jgi:hypothetical protein
VYAGGVPEPPVGAGGVAVAAPDERTPIMLIPREVEAARAYPGRLYIRT